MHDRDTVLADALESLDQVWGQIAARRTGISNVEYLWEPAADCWTVRRASGRAVADRLPRPVDPEPPPLTTIAWREWHIAVEALDSYSSRLFDTTGTGLVDDEWTTDSEWSGVLLERAWSNFRNGVADAGPDWLFVALGEQWGPYATRSRLALVLHAQHEVAHHGAEIALLRDLYRATTHPSAEA